MARLVALYRALNVGGRRITMDRLRTVHESDGNTDVRTHLASGNVVFSTRARDPMALARRLEAGFRKESGFASEVVLRSAEELRTSIEKNPFLGEAFEPKLAHTLFMVCPPSKDAVQSVLAGNAGPELIEFRGQEAYVYFAEGVARSKLNLRALDVIWTARNANTVAKLLDLLES